MSLAEYQQRLLAFMPQLPIQKQWLFPASNAAVSSTRGHDVDIIVLPIGVPVECLEERPRDCVRGFVQADPCDLRDPDHYM